MILTVTDFVLLYIVIGLVTLLVLIQVAKKDVYAYEDISENLGHLVVYGVLGWPYVVVLWVFTWSWWLK